MNILLVDDNEADHYLCKYYIAQYDSSITTFQVYDGLEALMHIEQNASALDYVFLDINMPRMTGIELLEQLNQDEYLHIDVPKIIMLTSSLQDKDFHKCMSFSQVKQFISKPIQEDALKDIFRAH